MRFFMPPAKTKIKLIRDFRFEVSDRWMQRMIQDNELIDPNIPATDINSIMTLFPEGSILELTKVYIRNDGYNDGDSLNLKLISTPNKDKIVGRSKTFTFPMNLANELDFEIHIEEN